MTSYRGLAVNLSFTWLKQNSIFSRHPCYLCSRQTPTSCLSRIHNLDIICIWTSLLISKPCRFALHITSRMQFPTHAARILIQACHLTSGIATFSSGLNKCSLTLLISIQNPATFLALCFWSTSPLSQHLSTASSLLHQHMSPVFTIKALSISLLSVVNSVLIPLLTGLPWQSLLLICLSFQTSTFVLFPMLPLTTGKGRDKHLLVYLIIIHQNPPFLEYLQKMVRFSISQAISIY